MKKSISRIIAILFAFIFLFQGTMVAFAEDNTNDDWQDISLTDRELEEIFALNTQSQSTSMGGAEAQATGLIINYAIAVSCSGSNLLIAGKTIGIPDVVKCGFTIVTIQRRKSSSYSWTDYRTYEDLYISTSSYTLTKSVAVTTGYQYRVTCTHYAKKNLLTTQKINNTSNAIAIPA